VNGCPYCNSKFAGLHREHLGTKHTGQNMWFCGDMLPDLLPIGKALSDRAYRKAVRQFIKQQARWEGGFSKTATRLVYGPHVIEWRFLRELLKWRK